MRKNKMMRAASALLVAVLLTTCAISGTFAKYVTTDEFTDTARVAKWGVELQIFGNLFGDTYMDELTVDKDLMTVKSRTSSDNSAVLDDIVAPGTQNNEGMTISLTGQPEVDGEVGVTIKTSNIYLAAGEYALMIPTDTVTENNFAEVKVMLYYADGANYVQVAEGDEFDADKQYYTIEDCTITKKYYPVRYTLAQGVDDTAPISYTPPTDDYTVDTLNAIAALIASKVGIDIATLEPDDKNVTTYETGWTPKRFETNQDLAALLNLDGVRITWTWAFDVNAVNKEADTADTILGLLENTTTTSSVVKLEDPDADVKTYVPVVEYKDYCLDTLFDIEITVSQCDNTPSQNP